MFLCMAVNKNLKVVHVQSNELFKNMSNEVDICMADSRLMQNWSQPSISDSMCHKYLNVIVFNSYVVTFVPLTM